MDIRQLLVFGGICLFAPWAIAEQTDRYQVQYPAQVTYVVDGDTIYACDHNQHIHKLRLANIDAPELYQAYGEKSKMALKEDILNQHVWVKRRSFDQYHREVVDIFYHGQDINLTQVANGNAYVYVYFAKRYLSERQQKIYYQAEVKERINKIGLWGDKPAIAPWGYRKEHRRNHL